MRTQQGDLALLNDPVAQESLQSRHLAKLAYVWLDGTPRVIPIWFEWTGEEVVLGTPPDAPKVAALAKNPKVALTIDSEDFPHKVLLIRGTARLETVAGVVPEYAAAARRYFGEEQGTAFVAQVRGMFSEMTRVDIQPEWVGILDFQTRFPSALERAMERAQSE